MSDHNPCRESLFNVESLRAAYLATAYQVDDAPGGPFVIRIGERSEPLDRLLETLRCSSWIYITACNPYSRPLDADENRRRMLQLEARLWKLNCRVFRGQGVGDDRHWPPEPSLLAVGLSESDGRLLGREFHQCAFVAGRRGEPAELVWLG
ncbi:MAG: DUF3293 domain-containing protein [Planctomycetales bacterium]